MDGTATRRSDRDRSSVLPDASSLGRSRNAKRRCGGNSSSRSVIDSSSPRRRKAEGIRPLTWSLSITPTLLFSRVLFWFFYQLANLSMTPQKLVPSNAECFRCAEEHDIGYLNRLHWRWFYAFHAWMCLERWTAFSEKYNDIRMLCTAWPSRRHVVAVVILFVLLSSACGRVFEYAVRAFQMAKIGP
jgi:hypothetical protein